MTYDTECEWEGDYQKSPWFFTISNLEINFLGFFKYTDD